jgi:N6-L-threonylcarbamoyladenine synthase
MRVSGVGEYELLGDTLDDAAGEAFDKTAKLLGLPYPGGPYLAKLAAHSEKKSQAGYKLPRPLINSGDLNFSFSGLKTAVLTLVNQYPSLSEAVKADIAWEFQEAVTDVLTAKCLQALKATGLNQLIVSGGVGANLRLREKLDAAALNQDATVRYPRLEFCTDNGAMIAFAGAMRLKNMQTMPQKTNTFSVKARWDLSELQRPS